MGGWSTVLIFSRVITIVGCRKFRFAQRSSFEWLGAPRQGVRRTLYLLPNSLLNVGDATPGLKDFSILFNSDPHDGVCGKAINRFDEAASQADVGGSAGDFCLRKQFFDCRGSGKRISRY